VTQEGLTDRSPAASAVRTGRRTPVTGLVRARRTSLRTMQGTRKVWRWFQRRWWPSAGPAVITTVTVVTAAAAAALIGIVHFNWWSSANIACHENDLGCHLGSDLIMDLLLAGFGLWIFMTREASAARSWRKTVRRRPEWLFLDGLPNPDGLTVLPLGRGPTMRPLSGARRRGTQPVFRLPRKPLLDGAAHGVRSWRQSRSPPSGARTSPSRSSPTLTRQVTLRSWSATAARARRCF
jgi:hypothetical protein